MGDSGPMLPYVRTPPDSADPKFLGVISERKLAVTAWEFGVAGRPPFGVMRLMPDGSIGNYGHPNERFWRLTQDGLVILDEKGEISTSFSVCSRRPDGRLAFAGVFAKNSEGTIHYLTELHESARPSPFRVPPACNPFWLDGDVWRVDVVRARGLGDALMTAATLRRFKESYPTTRVAFYTDYPELFSPSTYIDECFPTEAAPKWATHVHYESYMPTPYHVAQLIAFQLGLQVAEARPFCNVDTNLVRKYRESWKNLPRPWVVAQRRANPLFTPNKDWPERNWLELLGLLSEFGSVFDVGNAGEGGPPVHSPNYVDLRGATSIRELVAAVAAADLYVGPPSGPLHIAGAVGTRVVNIVGGFELPENTHYPNSIGFGSNVPCGPCALLSPCAYDRVCLASISPARVFEAVRASWLGRYVGQ